MKNYLRIYYLLILSLAMNAGCFTEVFAGGAEKLPLKPGNNLVFGIGFGYGLANNPLQNGERDKNVLSGAVLGATLGYKINSRLKIDFGPSVWIESKDIFNNAQGNTNRPSNKRLMISLNGYYYPIRNNSFNIKAGIGIGNILYTPENATVRMDNTTYENSEIGSGMALNFSLIYGFRISENIKIHPSLNFAYNKFHTDQSSHISYLDHSIPSLTTDLRLNFYISF